MGSEMCIRDRWVGGGGGGGREVVCWRWSGVVVWEVGGGGWRVRGGVQGTTVMYVCLHCTRVDAMVHAARRVPLDAPRRSASTSSK